MFLLKHSRSCIIYNMISRQQRVERVATWGCPGWGVGRLSPHPCSLSLHASQAPHYNRPWEVAQGKEEKLQPALGKAKVAVSCIKQHAASVALLQAHCSHHYNVQSFDCIIVLPMKSFVAGSFSMSSVRDLR